MELNIEHRKIEQPSRPTIRFSMPLFDPNGQKFGILTLNYNASALLQRIKKSGLSNGRHLSLLNKQGYWLESSDSSNTWGFMLVKRSNKVFKNKHPDVWKAIQASSDGQSINNDGLFTFIKVQPLDSIKRRLDNNLPPEMIYHAIPKAYTWILLSHIPANKTAAIIRSSSTTHTIVTALVLLIWLIISLILVYNRVAKEQTQQQLAEKDIQIRHIVDAAMNGIITINEHGIIQSFNPAATQMFGYEEDEAIGQNVSLIVSPPP